ncbi:hypothetical protein PRK78_005976 [Emydomyces testavorans]|uniref:Uncharacterized protein n=1 Tax=Emydomyces testavorans TaxID=2070801 RepID=A0AAF0DKL1_9EURO|nr:hypothetical protein PRK78_005976 [Emydomyces testavorans]
MTLIQMRELLQFPGNGDNVTDTIINGIHFNRTALTHFNYTLYSNGTLSNGSSCWLAFQIYKPTMLSNGTFINGTSCYSPIHGVGTRGSIGIVFASMFALTILFSLINLRRHGLRYLPLDKRWSLVGRRWQWYWMLFVGACGMVSCFMSIDVDRDYLQSYAIILQGFFYYLAFPAVLAAKQRSFDQQENVARPAATDVRFKSASVSAVVCVLLICYSLGHSLYRYKHRPQGRTCIAFYMTVTPLKFILTILLAVLRTGFGIASAFEWTMSPLKYNGNPGWLYGLGYTPVLLILLILNLYGYLDPNEDKDLIRQRIARGRAADGELGIDQRSIKPHWWKSSRPDYPARTINVDAESRLRTLAAEVGGGSATKNNLQKMVEMGVLDPMKYRDEDSLTAVPAEPPAELEWPRKDKFAVASQKEHKADPPQGGSTLSPDAAISPVLCRVDSQTTAFSGETLNSQARPQKVRSMLDI